MFVDGDLLLPQNMDYFYAVNVSHTDIAFVDISDGILVIVLRYL